MKKLKQKQPTWIGPMLARLIKKPFSNPEWLFEKKLDGVRCLVFSKNKKISMRSRNKLPLNTTYPKIYEALTKYKNADFIIDTEIVYDDGKLNSFEQLQKLNKKNTKNIRLFVFDLLFFNGYNLTKLPLIKRKEILRKAFDFNKTICFTTHKKTSGIDYFKRMTSHGFEGIIAKKLKAPYISKRCNYWLKIKSVDRQEFVICGYTKPKGQRKGFGALLLGFYKNKILQYAGKVGTGFSEIELKNLFSKLKPITTTKCPFQSTPKAQANWVKPRLIAECAFTEWTDDNKLRHPSYLGLRQDINVKQVKKECPKKKFLKSKTSK